MRTVLHLGAHKTGTSLVQKFFRDKIVPSGELPISYIPRADSNDLIGWGRPLERDPELLRSRLELESNNNEYVLVSHENALGRPFVQGKAGLYPGAERLGAALASIALPYDPVVVFYVRPLADFVESYYLQTIHQGATHSFEEWYETINASELKWSTVVGALQSSFGHDRVVVADFSEISSGQNDFLAKFLQRSGLPLPREINYKPVRNASVSSVGLELALKINPHLETPEQRRAARVFLQQNFSNVHGDRAQPMPHDVRQELNDQTATEYESVCLSGATIPPAPAIEPPKPPSKSSILRRARRGR